MRNRSNLWILPLLLASVTVPGCGGARTEQQPAGAPLAMTAIDPPAPEGAFAPGLTAAGDEALLTWWEPLPAPEGERRHRLMFSLWSGEWSAPSVVAEGGDYFANWADVPSAVREPAGTLLAFWLEKTAEDTFAYSIFLARSADEGATFEPLGKLNDDDTHTEHGFVSMVPEGDAIRAYWLDGRQMAAEGPMSVRTALVEATIGASELLDDRTCECCPTDAVATEDGSFVVFRDRAGDELREIHAVRRTGGEWTASEPVTADGWRVPGCPVNGPAVDREAGMSALAWFAAPDGLPRVSVAFSRQTPTDFTTVAVVDEAKPVGRVDLVLDGREAVVSWLGLEDGAGLVRLRRVARDGSMGTPVTVGRTSAGRSSGMPRLVRLGDDLVVAWVENGEGMLSRIRVRRLPAETIPSPTG